MIFRQLFDSDSSTWTYLVADPVTGSAALIDPVLEQMDRDLTLVDELGLKLTHVFDTHVHADHITASGALRHRTGCTVVGGRGGASCADVQVGHGDRVHVGELTLEVLATPGHTDDSASYLIEDRVFTGDALLVRSVGRTDFQNGDSAQLYDSIHRVLFALPDETLVFPGHDYKGRTATTIGEEKRHNTRASGRSREEFVRLMSSLQLPRPRKIELAVPANRLCGQRVDVSPFLLDTLDKAVRRIDVREPEEFNGPLGHLPGAELVPLGTLPAAAESWPRAEPLLLICRSGKRSEEAARLLGSKGFRVLYNLAGGMTAVREATAPADRA